MSTTDPATVDAFLRHAAPDWRMGGGPHQIRHRHTAERILRQHPEIAQTNLFTRIGTDFQVSVGFNYNAILNTFGFSFEILPNLLPINGRGPGMLGTNALSNMARR